MQKFNFKAFTLVELIVVITIVWILSTIGFVSYSWYLTGARDSNRTSQMVKLSDSLQVYSATKTLPLPDNYVEIEASWSLIAYQWEVWVDVLETIDYTNWGTDPKDGEYYTYYLTKDRKSMQLMAMMEEQSLSTNFNNNNLNVKNTYAADYEDRFAKVYGRKLWTLTQETTNTPIQQLSAFSSTPFEITTETGYTAHISDTEKIVWTVAWDLQASIKNWSCNRIKQTGWGNGGWFYSVIFEGIDERSIYCYMEWWEAVEDMLEWEWDFLNWIWISTLSSQWPLNIIENVKTPISSNFALHQTWTYSSQYVIDFKDSTLCQIWDYIHMTAWVAWDDGWIFHSRIYDSWSEVMSIATHPVERTILETKTIWSLVWNKYYYKHNITSTFTELRWFMWYGAEWTNGWPDETDLYITGVRLSCHP
jgi:type II secretory pathway pseudopilin PulG